MNLEYGIEPISLDGFQIINSRHFSRSAEPMMSLFPSGISFNRAAHEALNNCEFIEILINGTTRNFLIKPALGNKNNEAIRWQSNREKAKSSKMECSSFTKPIFKSWTLDEKYHYKAPGKLVQCEKKVMLLFDFSDCETWEGLKMIK